MRYIFCCLFIACLSAANAQSAFTSGGKIKPEQAIMDIRHYAITLDVDPVAQTIKGFTTIDLNLSEPTNILLFDLIDSFNISKVTVNNQAFPFTYSNNHITINNSATWPAGPVKATVWYGGHPHIAIRPPWDDGFTFTKDSLGNPWMSITAEAAGGKLYFPCKDHPSDEPDEGVSLTITVPKGLVVAGPGLLEKVTHQKGKDTYYWSTHYHINNYSILFNVGKYVVVERTYTTINGNKVPMQFYVLKEHEAYAQHHLDIFENTVHVQEKYFGEYPWAKEKIAIAETPHLGMEHQTMNAYGNKFRYTKVGGKDFDWLMHHEFGHEWWGNKVTAKDWGDYWIHEGINTFGDMLYYREMEGEQSYIDHMKEAAARFQNKIPVVIGTDIDEESAYNGDIYGKGAFFMHTLRYVMGDSIFFPTIKSLATDYSDSKNNFLTTADVQTLFSQRYGKSMEPLFHLFLYTTDKLQIEVHRTGLNNYTVRLANIDMDLPLAIVTDEGTQTITASKKPVNFKSKTFPVIDPDEMYLSRISYE